MQDSHDKTSKADREVEVEGLPVVRPNVAGIDLGSEKHWVCAPRVDGAPFHVTICHLLRSVSCHYLSPFAAGGGLRRATNHFVEANEMVHDVQL
jgi:hypothetical protein